MTNPYQIRLHKFLTDHIRQNNIEFTSPEIQRNIEKLGVLINDKMIFNRQEWLFGEPEISIDHWPKRTKGNFEKVKILLETPKLCLVFKPVGTVCQHGNGHLLDNLETFLNQNSSQSYPTHFLENRENSENPQNTSFFQSSNRQLPSTKIPEISQNQVENLAPDLTQNTQTLRAVHRLDKDTQGLILFARGDSNLEILQNEFRQRKVVKKYLAVVDGLVDKVIHINNWQARDARSSISQKFFWSENEAKSYDPNAKNAQSIIIPKAFCKELGQTIIQVQILTGRMHQIRLQCQNLGFPLTGDPLYQTRINLDQNYQNTKSLLKSPYIFEPISNSFTGNSQPNHLEIKISKLKHNFNSPKSDSTNSKQKKVTTQILSKIESKAYFQAISHNFNDSLVDWENEKGQTQNDGFYAFYGNKSAMEMSKLAFENLKLEIFGETDYCLLANFLSLRTPDFHLEAEVTKL